MFLIVSYSKNELHYNAKMIYSLIALGSAKQLNMPFCHYWPPPQMTCLVFSLGAHLEYTGWWRWGSACRPCWCWRWSPWCPEPCLRSPSEAILKQHTDCLCLRLWMTKDVMGCAWSTVCASMCVRLGTHTDDSWQVHQHHPLYSRAFDAQGYCLPNRHTEGEQ